MKTPLTIPRVVGLVASLALAACASAPETRQERNDLQADADETLSEMFQADASLRAMVRDSAGYVVFPEVNEGALIVGGTGSVGVAYEDGRPIGTVELRAGSFGAQVGGQNYAQLVVFRSDDAFDSLTEGDKFQITADASATVVRSGAAASAPSDGDVAIFVIEESGAMLEASVGGQRMEFHPSQS